MPFDGDRYLLGMGLGSAGGTEAGMFMSARF